MWVGIRKMDEGTMELTFFITDCLSVQLEGKWTLSRIVVKVVFWSPNSLVSKRRKLHDGVHTVIVQNRPQDHPFSMVIHLFHTFPERVLPSLPRYEF